MPKANPSSAPSRSASRSVDSGVLSSVTPWPAYDPARSSLNPSSIRSTQGRIAQCESGKLLKRALLVKKPSSLSIPVFRRRPCSVCPPTLFSDTLARRHFGKVVRAGPGDHADKEGFPRASGYGRPRRHALGARHWHTLLRGAYVGLVAGGGRNRDTSQPGAPRGRSAHPWAPRATNCARAGAGSGAEPGRQPGAGCPGVARYPGTEREDRRRPQRRHSLLGTGRFCGAVRRRSCSRRPLRKACTTPRGSPRASATATWTWRGQAPPFAALSLSRSCRIASA
jgi:hypothetical protein